MNNIPDKQTENERYELIKERAELLDSYKELNKVEEIDFREEEYLQELEILP